MVADLITKATPHDIDMIMAGALLVAVPQLFLAILWLWLRALFFHDE
jgi:hypothetical protein